MNRELDIAPHERKVLTMLRRRPSTLIRTKADLHSVLAYIRGYEFALRQHGEIHLLPKEFDLYVNERFTGQRTRLIDFDKTIEKHVPENAYTLNFFWKLLDEYLLSAGCEPIPEPDGEREVPHEPELDGVAPMERGDVCALADSYCRAFNADPWNDHWDDTSAGSRLVGLLCERRAYGFTAWRDRKPFGGVIGRVECCDDGNVLQIVELWVEPEYRHQGWGTRLLRALLHHLEGSDLRRIYLLTSCREETLGFYRSLGFAVQEDMCLMQRELPAGSEAEA